MPRFFIRYAEWHGINIEADSPEEAERIADLLDLDDYFERYDAGVDGTFAEGHPEYQHVTDPVTIEDARRGSRWGDSPEKVDRYVATGEELGGEEDE